MKAVGVLFGGCIAVLFFAISLSMVWQYGLSRSDTDIAGQTMAAFGVVAILYSMGGFTFSRFLKAHGRDEIANIVLAGLLLAEGCIIFCELGFHGLNIKATELRRAAQSIEVGVNQDQIENSRRVIRQLSGVPSAKETQAKIAVELAKVVSKDKWGGDRSLGIETRNCLDEKSELYTRCGTVLKLRADLATAEKFEAAQMAVSTTTSEKLTGKAPVNAGAEVGADMTGWTTDMLSHTQLWFLLGFLAIGRLTTVPVIALCLSMKPEPKAAPVQTSPAPQVVKIDLSPVTQAAVAAVESAERAPKRKPAQKRLAPPKKKPNAEPRVVLYELLKDLVVDGRFYYSDAEARLKVKYGDLSPQMIGRLLGTIATRLEKEQRGERREYSYRIHDTFAA